jgi:hypothetical protein
VVSGWQMRNVHLPARVAERTPRPPTPPTARSTSCARAATPWVLHLSYVKPHWPYMAPAPYHAMYTADQCLPVVRRDASCAGAPGRGRLPPARGEPHLRARRGGAPGAAGLPGADRAARRPSGPAVRVHGPAGLWRDTLVIFCADHGDFLGDHWLGEKELFYDTVQRVPFIVADPRPRADATRGTVDDAASSSASTWCPRCSMRSACRSPDTASRAAACCRCCAASSRPGATSSTASSTTASRARG